jgi:hypothetical protein
MSITINSIIETKFVKIIYIIFTFALIIASYFASADGQVKANPQINEKIVEARQKSSKRLFGKIYNASGNKEKITNSVEFLPKKY